MLKHRLASALVMSLPRARKGFVVYCDAFRVGLACVVMQHGKVISYVSRQLKVHTKNYPSNDLNLEVVVFALKIWRHYPYGILVDVYRHHKAFSMYSLKRGRISGNRDC